MNCMRSYDQYTHTYTHTHTHIYIYVYIQCVCIVYAKHIHIHYIILHIFNRSKAWLILQYIELKDNPHHEKTCPWNQKL